MTIPIEDIARRQGPRYLAIADTIATEVAAGRLAPGDRLPTHRDLAWRVGVTVGTVTRAYAELERRGVAAGEVGRGTFIRGERAPGLDAAAVPAETGVIDLSLNFPPSGTHAPDLRDALRRLADHPDLAALLQYQPNAGRREHREAGTEWLARRGLEVDPGRVAITCGAQHGMLIALSAATRPGDHVAAEALTYPGLMVAARMLGLRVDPLAMDDDGLLPEAVEDACRNGARAIYTIPTLQNPTTSVMPEPRRRRIAAIAERHGAVLIEDDLFGLLPHAAPPPLAAIAPEHTIYVTALSKSIAPGLRIGYVAAPERLWEGVRNAVRGTSWMATPLMAELASGWIRDGTADRLLAERRTECEARLEMARDRLKGHRFDASDGSLHVWLHLPSAWDKADFVGEAARRQVLVASDAAFTVGRPSPVHAIRVCLGPAIDRATLEIGLERLSALLDSGPPATRAII